MDRIIAITDDIAQHAAWLAAAEPLQRQLRPSIPDPSVGYMPQMFDQGAEMAILTEDEAVRAIAA